MTDPCETTITPTLITSAGIQQTLVAANSCGSKFRAYGNSCLVRVLNAGASMTVTAHNQEGGSDNVVTVAAVGSAPLNDVTFCLPAAGEFIDRDGYIHLTFSRVTDVTVDVLHVPTEQ